MNSVCSHERLELALAGMLNDDEEKSLHLHLDECELCVAEMERLVGGERASQEIASMFTPDDLDNALPLREECSTADFVVEHLEPSDDPAVLGRLGPYDVLDVIGRGGMGVVLRGFDRELKRFVAIKALAPHLAHSALARKRFAREAQAAAAVVNPHVIAIHQVQPSGQLPFLVMPLLTGESLAQRLHSRGTLELKEILRIGMQAAEGLAAAHGQGLIHRDVKPANILLEKGVERAVLTDFGLARAADDVSMTRWGVIAGTPEYMSPEQARGEALDSRSDLFSLGCVLYEMATGVSPFRADSTIATLRRIVDEKPAAMASLAPELPLWFIGIVARLLSKDPAERFASASEVSQLLEQCLSHVQQPTTVSLPKSIATPTVSRSGRPPLIRLLIAAAFAFSLVLAGVFMVLEWNKGQLTIQSSADDVPIRIRQGDTVVKKLTVTKSGATVRVAAGKYVVEVDGAADGIVVQGGTVSLQRRGVETVRIVSDGASQHSEMRDYDIRDLPIWDKEGRAQQIGLLCHYLGLTTVESKAADIPFGSYDAGRKCLWVQASAEKHQQIAELLSALRESRGQTATDFSKADSLKAYSIADLPLWTKDGKKQDVYLLMRYLRSTVDPPTWESRATRAAYNAETSQLIVQATPEIHNQLKVALFRQGTGAPIEQEPPALVLSGRLFEPVSADAAPIIACTGPKSPTKLGAVVAHADVNKGLDPNIVWLHVWDWSKSDVSRVMLIQKSELGVLAPDGKTMLSPEGETLNLANREMRQYSGFQVNDDQLITSVRLSPSGKYAAAMIGLRAPIDTDQKVAPNSGRSTLRLLELDALTNTGKKIGEFPANANAGVAFSTDETWLLYSSDKHEIIRRDAVSGNILNEYEPPVRPLNGVVGITASPDGRMVAAANFHGNIYLWETQRGKLVVNRQTLRDNGEPDTSFQAKVLRFSPDGTHLALVAGNRLKVMETQTGEIIKNHDHETSLEFTNVRWSPDAKSITLLTFFQPTNYVEQNGVSTRPTANIFPRVYVWDWREGSPVLKQFGETSTTEPGPTKGEFRAKSANNIKQILLAMHKYSAEHFHLPPAVIYGKNGKGGVPHSWRVELLKYLENGAALYDAYQFDEPWHSVANHKVLAQMPAIYRHPSEDPRSNSSAYFVVEGAANDASLPTAFSNKDGIRFRDILDGASFTIAVVETNLVVPWTKPEDILYDPEHKIPALGGFYREGFHVGTCDGSVKFLPGSISEKLLRAYFSPAGREQVPPMEDAAQADRRSLPDKDGVYWSDRNEDHWVTGMKVIQRPTAVNRKLVVEFLLRNDFPEAREIDVSVYCGSKTSLSLSEGNKASVDIKETRREKVTAAPNAVLAFKEGRAEISFAGLESGEYTLRFQPVIYILGKDGVGHGVPFNLSLPVTYDASYASLPIHWGKPIAGLRLGAMFQDARQGEVKRFALRDQASIQLFVQNISPKEIECGFDRPYHGGDWGTHITDSAGQRIEGAWDLELMRIGIRIQPSPHWAHLAPGEIQPISGELPKFRVGNEDEGSIPNLKHAHFMILQETPEKLRTLPPYDYVLPAGEYSARFSATLRKFASPDVTFAVESARIPFQVGLSKLPDEAYTRAGIHCQKFREEDAKRPGGERMGPVRESERGEDPLVLGMRVASDAKWNIGGQARVELVVRNASRSDVKFTQTPRSDNGLSVVAIDKDGKEHQAEIAQFDGLLVLNHLLLPPSHLVMVKSFTLRFDPEKRGVSVPGVAGFHLPPGDYSLRCKWNDARPEVAHEGEWTGELVSVEHKFKLAAAPAVSEK